MLRQWRRCSVTSTLSDVLDELRAAVDALNRGDAEPFIALLDDNTEWRGVGHGHLWWKQEPS